LWTLSSPYEPAEAVRADRSRLLFWLVGTAGAAVSALAMTIVLTSSGPGDRPLIALAQALVVALPVGVGLWAWRRQTHERFGRLLVAAGFLWALSTLAQSNSEAVYSIGRVGGWLVEPVLIWALLSYPSGRLPGRLERAVLWASIWIVAVLYVPTALLVERYPEPSPYATCVDNCPDNAFMAVGTEPAVVDAVVRPLRDTLTVLLFLAVLALLMYRFRHSTRLLRLTLTPVLAVGFVRGLMFVAYLPLRRADAGSPALEVLSWIFVLSLPALALAFLTGLLRARLFSAEALERLAPRLRNDPAPQEMDAVLREVMDDPSLELAYWIPGRPGRWVDAAGQLVRLPGRDSGRRVTEVREDGRPVAALIHDAALSDQQEFVEAAASLALTALENRRLAATVDASLAELSESRARIQEAADSERRRIERDLHDGAQQRLVALRIRLGLAGELVRDQPERGAELMRELGAEAEEALAEVRSLAHGVYPSVLADQGIGEALRAVARTSPLQTSVATTGLGRYPPAVESAVYFCALEALQNAVKHARGGRAVTLAVVDDGSLRFEVRDDGAGFAADGMTPGKGLTNMRDRLVAVGGELWIHSEPGAGTLVLGTIPLPANAEPERP
jgi:signal transduction histidine kinase